MAEKKEKTRHAPGNPTQSFLRTKEIKQDTMVMEDGTLRAILAVSSTNFDLKSQSEQDALIFAYQRFLNSLDFSIQILLQSRKMDIAGYTEKLKDLMEKQTNELLRMQTAEYIEFVNRLVETGNIMNKNFYCVIPYNESIGSDKGGFFSSLFTRGRAKAISKREQNFEHHKALLEERVTSVSSNLNGMGLRAVELTTEQIIELIYNSYNFEAAPLIDASQLDNVTLTPEETA
jgi:hypothetical protein